MKQSCFSPALLTDLYELTMAYAYWKSKTSDKEAVFHLTFRTNPFAGGYSVACGLSEAIEAIKNFSFDDGDISYLASLKGNDGSPLFERDFLEYLRDEPFRCHVDAVPEGTVVFPHEPLVRVQGPIIQSQILESILLNIIGFQTLIATKASRVAMAAKGEPVIEFGLRRAQGIDGALAASRAAYIGGCAGTSNVLAGRLYGIPVKGTHAHSWIMSFDDEMEAFQVYAEVMPHNAIFLVDTYDSLEGVTRAIEAGKWLRKQGREMAGIRLDSGDLSYLSIEARRLLDEAGFPEAVIVGSNELDEGIIESLKQQGCKINVWGVGTKLVTAYDQPALGVVYKLSAVRERGGKWKPRLKLSEQTAKISNPGILQIRRYTADSQHRSDVIYDIGADLSKGCIIIDPLDMTRQKHIPSEASYTDLLIPVFRDGKCVYAPPSIKEMRKRTIQELGSLHAGVKRFVNPHQYPVGLEKSLFELKSDLILSMRKLNERKEG